MLKYPFSNINICYVYVGKIVMLLGTIQVPLAIQKWSVPMKPFVSRNGIERRSNYLRDTSC